MCGHARENKDTCSNNRTDSKAGKSCRSKDAPQPVLSFHLFKQQGKGFSLEKRICHRPPFFCVNLSRQYTGSWQQVVGSRQFGGLSLEFEVWRLEFEVWSFEFEVESWESMYL